MNLEETTWENFDSRVFQEMCCAGGASGISASAPEHMLGIISISGIPSEDDEADASKPDGKAIKPRIDDN